MYVIYNALTTEILNHKGEHDINRAYYTEAAAKAARTRACKVVTHDTDISIAPLSEFVSDIEKKVERTNAMTGKSYMERVNANFYTSPCSETYWCS